MFPAEQVCNNIKLPQLVKRVFFYIVTSFRHTCISGSALALALISSASVGCSAIAMKQALLPSVSSCKLQGYIYYILLIRGVRYKKRYQRLEEVQETTIMKRNRCKICSNNGTDHAQKKNTTH